MIPSKECRSSADNDDALPTAFPPSFNYPKYIHYMLGGMDGERTIIVMSLMSSAGTTPQYMYSNHHVTYFNLHRNLQDSLNSMFLSSTSPSISVKENPNIQPNAK